MIILVIVLIVLFGGVGIYSYRRPRPYNGYRFNLFRRRPRQTPPPPRPMEPMGGRSRLLDTMGPGPQMDGPMNNQPMGGPGGNMTGQPRGNGPMGGQGNGMNRRPR